MGDDPGRPEAPEDARIQTFLIADVRGYTLFTPQRGPPLALAVAGS